MRMQSVSKNTSLYKCNAFSILTKYLTHTVAVTFAAWGATAKLLQISFFFIISWIEDLFLPGILVTSA